MRVAVARTLRVFLVLFVLAAAGLASVAYVVQQRLLIPVVPGNEPIRLVIEPGMSFQATARRLAQLGGYKYPRLLSYYARYKKSAGRVQAGEYELAPQLDVDGMLAQITRGDVVTYALTVVEGWTFREFRSALADHPMVRATIAPDATAAEIMTSLGHTDLHPEGRFFPDTYVFARGTADSVILRQAFGAMATRLEKVWAARTTDCLLASADEALILASIIEKETGRADERRQIAGVFCRRLAQGMRLQTDPTVIYGLGPSFNGDITRRDLRTDTPYNTYTRSGLPPTPIALPGAESLAAAVDPEEGDTLFFVATGDGDGSHYFSRTLAEHEKALARYLKKLRAN